jgi:N-methylhydantoinase B/oxoprolinase/acetone carboxylase alpha subunit
MGPGVRRMPCKTYMTVPSGGLIMAISISMVTMTPNQIRDGQKQALRSKVTNMMLKDGDIIRLETSGGGGFGEARLRAREFVERDVRLGYVSAAAAKSSYGHSS